MTCIPFEVLCLSTWADELLKLSLLSSTDSISNKVVATKDLLSWPGLQDSELFCLFGFSEVEDPTTPIVTEF